jgi:hypothetical protein
MTFVSLRTRDIFLSCFNFILVNMLSTPNHRIEWMLKCFCSMWRRPKHVRHNCVQSFQLISSAFWVNELHTMHYWNFLRKSCFCVLKKWVHSRIGQCVRPSVRLHDNSSQLHSIELKFCAQTCLINISVEFEDENDPSRNGWVIEKIVIIDQTIPEGDYRDFFKKIFFSELFI